jgi:hypothetical protein
VSYQVVITVPNQPTAQRLVTLALNDGYEVTIKPGYYNRADTEGVEDDAEGVKEDEHYGTTEITNAGGRARRYCVAHGVVETFSPSLGWVPDTTDEMGG